MRKLFKEEEVKERDEADLKRDKADLEREEIEDLDLGNMIINSSFSYQNHKISL